jgi:hypothetical protein
MKVTVPRTPAVGSTPSASAFKASFLARTGAARVIASRRLDSERWCVLNDPEQGRLGIGAASDLRV